MMHWLAYLGASATQALGVLAIFRPDLVQKFVSVRPVGAEGKSEIRATYGGFFAALSLYALISGQPTAFVALGAGWMGAAFIRTATLFFGLYSPRNIAGCIFEAAIGALCLSVLLA